MAASAQKGRLRAAPAPQPCLLPTKLLPVPISTSCVNSVDQQTTEVTFTLSQHLNNLPVLLLFRLGNKQLMDLAKTVICNAIVK